MPDPDDRASAALEEARDELDHIRAGIELASELPMTADPRRVVDVYAPRLLAAVEAVLELAARWDAERDREEDRSDVANERGEDGTFHLASGRAHALDDCARALREAITRELTGKETDHA